MGACFDIVEEVCNTDYVNNLEGWLLSDLQFCLLLQSEIVGVPRLEVLWRTLIANTSPESEIPAPESFRIGFRSEVRLSAVVSIRQIVDSGQDRDDAIRTMAALLDKLGATDELQLLPSIDEIMEVYELLFRVGPSALQDAVSVITCLQHGQEREAFEEARVKNVGNRRLLRTRRGMLAFGPASAQAGDQIWLIRDARTPFILHPVPNDTTYTLVGDCYVHGFMHGEMLDPPWNLGDQIGPVNIV